MMSTKTKQTSPIKVRKIPHKEDLPHLTLGVFRWMPEDFVDISTGETGVKVEVWRICASVSLKSIMTGGRKRMLGETRDPKTGRRSFNYVQVFGSEALAVALSGVFPCTIEQAQELIKKAKSMNLKFALLCLKSDLYPTDIETFKKMGLKNLWTVIKSYPSRDDMNRKLNSQLKKAKSPLRIRSGLRSVLVE